ncbi:MAG: hypothetical protein ABID84_05115 [Chloroflexota bacterium]
MEAIIGVIVGAALGLVGAYFQNRWSDKRNAIERKAEYYTNILGHLSTLRFCNWAFLREETEGLPYSNEYREELMKLNHEAKIRVEQADATGDVYMPKEAAESLHAVLRVWSNSTPESYYDDLETTAKVVNTAITNIVQAAKNDLKVK